MLMLELTQGPQLAVLLKKSVLEGPSYSPYAHGSPASPIPLHPDYHWSPFVGHMPMTPGTFNAIHWGEFCGPGWSQAFSPTGSVFAVPPTPPTTPSTPASASQGWKHLSGARPAFSVQVSPGAWHDLPPQVSQHDANAGFGPSGLSRQRSRLGKQPSVGTHLEPIADGAESSTQGDEGSESIEGRSPSAGGHPSRSNAHGRSSKLQRRSSPPPEPPASQPYVPMSEQAVQDMLSQGGDAPPTAVLDLAMLMQSWGLAPSLDPEHLASLKQCSCQPAAETTPGSASGSCDSCHTSLSPTQEAQARQVATPVWTKATSRRNPHQMVTLNARQRRTLKRAQERAQAALAGLIVADLIGKAHAS
ncbi:hypothetical protein WJX84_009747 [Apatococcus fuscideae]|uniref:Uncharacterized protein n=1 Tax=Apatococcus fuscideae TaxID=2026836 RepID=A0AAW1TD24_9CHLO